MAPSSTRPSPDSSVSIRSTYAVVDVDGGTSAPATVTLTVKPPPRINHFTVSRIKTHRDGSITFRVEVPGPGAIDVLETAWNNNLARPAALLQPAPRRFVVARRHRTARRATTLQFRVTPDVRGEAARARSHVPGDAEAVGQLHPNRRPFPQARLLRPAPPK